MKVCTSADRSEAGEVGGTKLTRRRLPTRRVDDCSALTYVITKLCVATVTSLKLWGRSSLSDIMSALQPVPGPGTWRRSSRSAAPCSAPPSHGSSK